MTTIPESWEQQLHDAAHAIPDAEAIDEIGDTEGQPDGITNDSHDLPDPSRAAHRIGEFLAAYGDGIVMDSDDCDGVPPLYARDLEALRKEQERVDGLEAIDRELRAENDRLRAELADAERYMIRDHQQAVRATQGRDEARAEVERLRARLDNLPRPISTLTGQPCKHAHDERCIECVEEDGFRPAPICPTTEES